MTDQTPDVPLDLGPIDPGEIEGWVPGLTRRGREELDRRLAGRVILTREEVRRAAEQCTWANRREGIDDTLVDWPAEAYEAEAIITKALEFLGFVIPDE